jgi:poly-gamma-glutamate capsule biosynthesis protein CapA/YwtB (metallophosphatase superfamily)
VKFRLFLLLPVIFIQTSCKSQEVAISVPAPPDTSALKLVFVGDAMGHMPVVNAAWVDSLNTYDFLPSFELISNYVSKADMAVVNLEVPLAGKPYSGYPQFSSPNELGKGLKDAGFDILVNANNHALDRGKKGFLHTIDALDSLQVLTTGSFRDSIDFEKRNPLIIEKNKIKLALLNYSYGANGFKPEKPTILNFIDTVNIRKAIQKTKSLNPDLIIVILHWGNEYERYPNKEQRKVGEFIQRCGADAIIGSHPHVIQPIERYYPDAADRTKIFPVVYSMGNFLSNQRERYRNGGIMVELTVQKINDTRITSISYVPAWVYKGYYNGRMIYRLVPPSKLPEAIEKYNISKQDSAKATEFYNDTRMHLNNIPEITTIE